MNCGRGSISIDVSSSNTWAQILNAIYSAADFSKITDFSKIRFGYMTFTNNAGCFSTVIIGGDPITVRVIAVTPSNGKAYILLNGNTTDISATSPAVSEVTLYY